MMRSDLVVALVVGVALILLVFLSRRLARADKVTPVVTKPPRAKRAPKPFAGLTRQPDCPACEQEAEVHPTALTPNAPPPTGHNLTRRGDRALIDSGFHEAVDPLSSHDLQQEVRDGQEQQTTARQSRLSASGPGAAAGRSGN